MTRAAAWVALAASLATGAAAAEEHAALGRRAQATDVENAAAAIAMHHIHTRFWNR